MQHVRIKTVDGAWEDKQMDGEEILEWFKDNSKDGAVCGDITLFTDALFNVEKQEDTVEWVMSDMSLDRDQERVDPEGADFKNFKKNPVVLWAHDYTRPAIGKILNPKAKDGKVTGKVEFDSKDNDEFAWMIGQKVKKGIINGGSIGFKPNNVEFVEEPKDSTRLIHRKWELMEFSICNVPANVNALAQRAEVGMNEDEKKLIVDLAGKVAALETKIQAINTGIEKESYITRLFEDRGETSPDATKGDKVDMTIDGLFVAGETSSQKTPDKTRVTIFGI